MRLVDRSFPPFIIYYLLDSDFRTIMRLKCVLSSCVTVDVLSKGLHRSVRGPLIVQGSGDGRMGSEWGLKLGGHG